MPEIQVIDQTIREGMQYRGLMFSRKQRENILSYQAALGVNICQAAYPPAHVTEVDHVRHLAEYAQKKGFDIRVAGLGRVFPGDVRTLLDTGIGDIHLHMAVNEADVKSLGPGAVFQELEFLCETIIREKADAVIGISLLDMGKSDTGILKDCCSYLAQNTELSLITLPDTSGIMAPNQVADLVSEVTVLLEKSKKGERQTRISIHCHNDMGMASANTIMGVLSGASVIEVTALGIGERNGIGDLFTVCRLLEEQGIECSVKTSDEKLFLEYYTYVSEICKQQTGEPLLSYGTPFFGDAAKTHVAGTHAQGEFGTKKEAEVLLNVLCGKSLVRKYLKRHGIVFLEENLKEVTNIIKQRSADLGRALGPDEVKEIAETFS